MLGWGTYGNNPHTHWLLTKPPHMVDQEFTSLIEFIASTTRGIGRQRNIQTIYGPRVIEYIVGHGFEGLLEQVTFTAKYPVH